MVNNVKTWASVAPILTRGAAWYAGMGTKRTPGTTIFSLEGAVKNAGLVEVPFGISLREMIYEIGGGMAGDRPLKAVQAGGASARLHPALDARPAASTPKTAPGETIMIGTGGIIVLDDSGLHGRHGPLPRRLLPGRVVRQVRSLPRGDQADAPHPDADLRRPAARRRTWPLLERLAKTVRSAAVCGMGSMAPSAVLTTLAPFPRRVRERISADKQCPAGVCRDWRQPHGRPWPRSESDRNRPRSVSLRDAGS